MYNYTYVRRTFTVAKIVIQHRRGTTAMWEEFQTPPADGELVIELCEDGLRRYKFGDGVTLFKDLPYPSHKMEQALAELDSRLNLFVATPMPGVTQVEKEVVDIRVGVDGSIIYESAGAAVRAIDGKVEDLRRSLQQFINADAVDGLYYEDSMLYLTAGSKILEETGVQIISGSGGGGGGGGYTELKIGYITPSPVVFSTTDKILIKFTFTGTDSSGDKISQANATWKVNGQTVEYGIVKDGENEFDATKYMEVGTSSLFLQVTDSSGGKVNKTWDVQKIDVRVESDFNDKITYPIDEVVFDYKPFGAIEKVVHFILDDEALPTVTSPANISGTSVKYPVPARPHGSHRLEVYITATINGVDVESNHITKDILWYDPISNTDPVIGTSIFEFTANQYDITNIEYTVYDPSTESPQVEISVDGKVVSTPTLTKPTNIYSFTTAVVGSHVVRIRCGNTEKTIVATISKLDINIAPITTGLAFDFNPVGKSNSDSDRLWQDGDVSMRVSNNFDWINGGYRYDESGDPYFCIKSGTTATIDYKLFSDDAKKTGKEVKIVFKTTNVANPDAIFITCVDGTTATDKIGLEMGVHSASIYGQNGELELAYSENDIIEFEFNISKQTETVPMIMGYEDGVSSRPKVYDATYNFKQSDAKEIVIGSPDCDVHIYRFKAYNTSLTASEILSNFTADARTATEMISRYNRNQIYNENQKLTPEVLAEKCPQLRVYMVSAPHFTNNKSDKVINTTIRQIYKAGDPVLDNWTAYKSQHSGQGTSSNNYGASGRNLDFIMNKSGIDGVKPYIELGDGTIVNKISLTRESVPVAYLNAKVNIASSNNLTNAMLANRYNKFNPYKRPFVREDESIIPFIKDTMEFHNCVIFIQETDPDLTTHREFADTDWHFYAIGNIGDSKKTDDTRLTDPDDKYECCVELMDVELPLSDFPANTMYDAMGYKEDENTHEKIYTWAKPENLGMVEVDGELVKDYDKCILFELINGEYVKSSDTEIDFEKTYYVDILENDDFSEDFTYGWRYIWEDGTDEQNQEVFDYCKRKWIEFYRFLTTSTDEEFKAHFGDYFVKDSALYYYLFTTRYCMVDNRAKNTFWHYSKTMEKNEDGSLKLDNEGQPIRKWDLCWDYDNDTSLGLNNYGKQVYRYGLEDTDRDDKGEEIFREMDSTFFCRVRDCFPNELKTMYNTLESKNAWHAESFLVECDNWQSQFPEELWRLDIERKYIRTYTSSFITGGGDAQFLTNMSNGKMKYHRRQWERSQAQYMASKYQTSTAAGENSVFRCSVPTGDLAIQPNYRLKLTPYAYMYLNVKYGTMSPIQVKAEPNKEFEIPYTGSGADIVDIYNASLIKDFGNLASIYATTADTTRATRVKSLILGSDVEGYSNPGFTTLTTGSNPLLEELNVENVTGLNQSLDMRALINLKKLYAFGTGARSALFAEGGKIEEVELPALNSITLKDLMYLKTDKLTLESYDNVLDLIVEGCPQIDSIELLDRCKNVKRLRLLDIVLNNVTYEFFRDNIFKLKGLNASDEETENAWLTGVAKFGTLTGTQYTELRTRYPFLNIEYEKLICTVTFYDTDMITPLHTEIVYDEADCPDPVPNKIDKPTKASTISTIYEWSGWSTKKDLVTANPSPLLKVSNDLHLYPTFNTETRKYMVRFYNDDLLLYAINTPYGSDAVYPFEQLGEPEKQNTQNPEKYIFIGWDPSPLKIKGETNCYAQFKLGSYDIVPITDIDYTLNESDKELTIINYKNPVNAIIEIPDTYKVGTIDYTVTTLTGKVYEEDGTLSGEYIGFSHSKLELAKLPDSIIKIGPRTFSYNDKLQEINIPVNVSRVEALAFAHCKNLKKVYYDAKSAYVDNSGEANTISSNPFEGCTSSEGYDLYIGDSVEVIPTYMFFQSQYGNKSIRNLVFGENSKCHTIRSSAFAQCHISSLDLPTSLRTIGSSAFSGNRYITELVLPEGVESVDASAFEHWDALTTVHIPSTLNYLAGATFRYSAKLTTFICAEKSKYREINHSLVDTKDKVLMCGTNSSVIPDDGSVLSISSYAFASLDGLTNVIVPNTVTNILDGAFSGCANLESIELPDTLHIMSAQLFYQSSKLKNVRIPSGLQSIKSFALGYTAIETLTLPKTLNHLGAYFTAYCPNLKEVTLLSETAPTIDLTVNNEVVMFSGCNNLKTIRVGWSEGDIPGAPWGAPNPDVQIIYNYRGE